VTRLPDEYADVTYRMDNLPYFTLSWVSVVQSAVNLWGAVPKAALTPDDLRRIRSPVLLVWGSDDPFGSVETGRAGATYFPDAEFHEVGVGHLPWLDEPVACGERVCGFLAGDDTSTARSG
jgi:pimeloyl-ACP methyl ester carboxylesterase